MSKNSRDKVLDYIGLLQGEGMITRGKVTTPVNNTENVKFVNTALGANL